MKYDIVELTKTELQNFKGKIIQFIETKEKCRRSNFIGIDDHYYDVYVCLVELEELENGKE